MVGAEDAGAVVEELLVEGECGVGVAGFAGVVGDQAAGGEGDEVIFSQHFQDLVQHLRQFVKRLSS